MLHLADARKMLDSGQPCDIAFWKRNGEIVYARNVVCTSSNFQRNTFNLKWIASGEIRKIRAILIFNINGEEVFL